jgi:hypothetical protein
MGFITDYVQPNQNISEGRLRLANNYIESYHESNFNHPYYGVFMVSSGGETLSSLNNPSINANVPLPATLGLLGLTMDGLSFRRKSV